MSPELLREIEAAADAAPTGWTADPCELLELAIGAIRRAMRRGPEQREHVLRAVGYLCRHLAKMPLAGGPGGEALTPPAIVHLASPLGRPACGTQTGAVVETFASLPKSARPCQRCARGTTGRPTLPRATRAHPSRRSP